MPTVRFLALFVSLALVGCSKPPPPAPVVPPKTPATGTVPRPVAGPVSPSPDPSAAAVAFGTDFLKALKAGTADPTRLTPAFKKVIAPAAFESDKARGYSEWAAAAWLKEFAGNAEAVTNVTPVPLGGGASLVVAGQPSKEFTTVRVVPADGGFVIDWVQASSPRPAADLSADPAARFAAVAFVDAVLTKSPNLAVSLLDPAAAARLAPPLDDDDKAVGYNRSLLGFKLDGFRGTATSATVNTFTKVGNRLSVTGGLTGPGTPRPFTVIATETPTGWRITQFQAN